MTQTKHLVAVDLGSNSFHLVIAREQAGCIKIVHAQKQRVFLGTGLNDENILSESAIKRGVECLSEFSHSFSHLESICVRVVATHALRRASNREAFIKAAYKVFPYPIEVISGESEAALIYQGVAHTQPIKGRTLIIDIGGGSTEMVIGKNFRPKVLQSLEMGSSSLSTLFFDDQHITLAQMKATKAHVCKVLQPSADQYRQIGWDNALGTSGSIKAVSLSIEELYQEKTITKALLKALKKQLIEWGHSDHIKLKCIDKRRKPLLAAAVAMLLAYFEMLSITELSFSAGALREGVLYGLSNSRPDSDIRQRTINNLCELHFIDQAFSQQVLQQIHTFNLQLARHDQQLDKVALQYLRWAAALHEIGITINRKSRQKHGKYIIENSDMPGFDEEQQHSISLLIAHHRGNLKANSLLESTSTHFLQWIQLFRLSVILARNQSAQDAGVLDIHYRENVLCVTISPNVIHQSELMVLLENEVSQTSKLGLPLLIHSG